MRGKRPTKLTSIERRFERLLRAYRLETQELRQRLISELETIFEMATAIATGEIKTQMVDGKPVRITLMQRQKWARAAAYIAQIIHSIARGFDEREIDDMLEEARRLIEEARGGAERPGGEAEGEEAPSEA
jgi:predicted transcriptional regulator